MCELKAPFGKIRVISVDLFANERYLVDDFADEASAFAVADAYNNRRTSDMDTVYYAYNDLGNMVRSHRNVHGPGIAQ